MSSLPYRISGGCGVGSSQQSAVAFDAFSMFGMLFLRFLVLNYTLYLAVFQLYRGSPRRA